MASILSNASIATGGRVVNGLLGLFVVALLTRVLTPLGYGIYGAVLSYGTLFQIAADFGLYLTLTRLLGSNWNEGSKKIAFVVSLRLALLGLFFIGAFIIAQFFSPLVSPFTPLLFICIGLICQSLSQLAIGIYQATSNIWPATSGDGAGRIVQLLGVGILYWYGVSSEAVVWASVIFAAGSATALFFHILYLPHRPHFMPKVQKGQWQRLIQVSWPLGLLLVLNTIYFRIDMVMLPIWRSATEVGYYALAYRLIEHILFFPAMFGGLLLPHVSRAAVDRQHLGALLGQTLQVILLGAAALIIVLGLFPEVVVGIVAGAQFGGSVPLLRILTIALACMCFGNIFGFVLVAQAKNRTLLKLYALLVVVTVLANWLTIPRYGAMAAAWVTVAIEAIATGVSGFIVLRSVALRFTSGWLIRFIAACLGSFLAISFLPQALPGIGRLGLALMLYVLFHISAGTLLAKNFSLLLAHPTDTYA